MTEDRGSAAIEMVLLTPLLVTLLLFVVHVGRAGAGVDAVRHAADQGARAASLVSESRMRAVAESAVVADLARSERTCARISVSTDRFVTGSTEWVTVRVSCSTSSLGLGLLGVGSTALSASSTEVIDRFRGGE